MAIDWTWTLGIGALLVAVALLAWSVRSGSRGRIVGAVVGGVIGAAAGFVILTAANQPGLASLTGFYVSVALGAIVVGLLVYGLRSGERRAAALVTAGTMVAAAVAVSQLVVALTRE